MWDTARAGLRGNFIALNVHTGKKLSKITYLSSPIKNKKRNPKQAEGKTKEQKTMTLKTEEQ